MIADFSESERVAKRLQSATANLHRMANDVGHARQIKEFCGDMKKNLLAKWMIKFIRAGDTAAAAEVGARSEPDYITAFGQLQEQYEEAERVISRWNAEQASFEAARSLLSFEKETMHALTE